MPVAPSFDSAALELLHARYLVKNAEGRVVETSDDMFRRRAANITVMDLHHPDIETFVTAKCDSPGLRTFNLSVACDDAFMQAVQRGEDIPLVNFRTGQTVARRGAAGLFDLIVECAWATGDPGLLFLDRINQDNPTPALGRITATNPCGEVPLLAHEACLLGSINLARLTRGNSARLGTAPRAAGAGGPFSRRLHRCQPLSDPRHRAGRRRHAQDRRGGHGLR